MYIRLSMKRYQLRYLMPNDKSRFIVISWEQGLCNFKAMYEGETFFECPTVNAMNKGVSVFHEKLGNVFIRICTQPIGFEVKVGDLYLDNSRILAQEDLSSISAIWIFLGIMSTLGSVGMIFMYSMFVTVLGSIIAIAFFAISIFYIVAGALIKKGHIWAYYLAVGLFTGITLLYFFDLVGSNIPIIALRVGAIVVTIRSFKSMQDLSRHYKTKRNQTSLRNKDTLLDNL